MESAIHSRWTDEPRLDETGKVIPVDFGELDLEICKLLTPPANARYPWGYQYLPASYLAPLLGRGPRGMSARLYALRCRPYSYLRLPDQPEHNFRDRIFAVAPNGIDEVREDGFQVPKFHHKQLPHELMACIIGASFEIGARKHSLPIELADDSQDDVIPDWPKFKLNAPTVYLEADTGSETISASANFNATTLAGKFDGYLELIRDRRFRGSMALFYTTRLARMESMIAVLQKTIDKKHYPHKYAEQFGFTHIRYSRFLNKIPKLTDWAVTTDYRRAGAEPFNFLK